MTVLFIAVALPKVNAQVHVGDLLYGDNSVVGSGKAIGVVFYVDATKQHGWAVALNDQGSLAWGPNYVSTPLPDRKSMQEAVADVNGYGNTERIIAISNSPEGPHYPAFDTLDFSNGWYLPALGQLKRLYANLDKVNASLSAAGGTTIATDRDEYWSSTEYSLSSSWFMDPEGKFYCKDATYNGTKDGRRLVRAVRSF